MSKQMDNLQNELIQVRHIDLFMKLDEIADKYIKIKREIMEREEKEKAKEVVECDRV